MNIRPITSLPLASYTISPNGVNDDITIQAAIDALINAQQGGKIFLRAGRYVLKNPITLKQGGIVIEGEARGRLNQGGVERPATILNPASNNMTLIRGSANGLSTITQWGLRHFALDTDGKTGIAGIDLTQPNVSAGGVLEDVMFGITGTGNTAYTTALILDGNEDTFLSHCEWQGGLTAPNSTTTNIKWAASSGNIHIHDCIVLPATTDAMRVDAQTVRIRDSTIYGGIRSLTNIQYFAEISGCYWSNQTLTPGDHFILAPGSGPFSCSIHDNLIISTGTTNLVNNGGTVNNFNYVNNALANLGAGTTTLYTGNFPLSKMSFGGTSNNGGLYAGEPWTTDANFGYIPPSFLTTPANPAGTVSTVGVMAGLNQTLKMARSGRVLVSAYGTMANNTINDGAKTQIRFGTGAAPVNGAALTGTAVGTVQTVTGELAANNLNPFSLQASISGLLLGTTYWFDLMEGAITGGTASLANMTYSVGELP